MPCLAALPPPKVECGHLVFIFILWNGLILYFLFCSKACLQLLLFRTDLAVNGRRSLADPYARVNLKLCKYTFGLWLLGKKHIFTQQHFGWPGLFMTYSSLSTYALFCFQVDAGSPVANGICLFLDFKVRRLRCTFVYLCLASPK